MKSMLIAVTVVGVVIAGLVLYLANESETTDRKVINVEDGTPVPY